MNLDLKLYELAHRQALADLHNATHPDDRREARILIDEAQRRMKECQHAAPQRFVMKSPRPGEWLIGPEDSPRWYKSDLVGLSALWLAIGNGIASVCDAVGPEVENGDAVVRRAIRKTAADWLEKVAGCRPLAGIAAGLPVEGGRVIYVRRPLDPEVITGL